jgi:hypothetical protein
MGHAVERVREGGQDVIQPAAVPCCRPPIGVNRPENKLTQWPVLSTCPAETREKSWS